MSQPYRWYQYTKDEARWERSARYWARAILISLGLLAVLWLYLVLLFA